MLNPGVDIRLIQFKLVYMPRFRKLHDQRMFKIKYGSKKFCCFISKDIKLEKKNGHSVSTYVFFLSGLFTVTSLLSSLFSL